MPAQDHLRHAVQPLERPAGYVSRAAKAAWYPIRGILHFVRHREFWPLFLGRLLPLSLISLLVYFILFTFAFLPQYAFLAIFNGWDAWLSAVVLVLGEGYVIIQGLFEGFFVDEYRVDAFDATLIDRGLIDLVAPHRLLFLDAPNSVKKLGKPTSSAIYQPWSIKQMIELVVYLPLNFIPTVGVPAYILITGYRLGTFAHYRWYQLRGLDRKERKRENKSRRWDYLWYGTVCMLMELVPVLSFFFLLTSATGSAIWASKLEERMREPAEAEAAPERANEQRSDEPPAYVDNPV